MTWNSPDEPPDSDRPVLVLIGREAYPARWRGRWEVEGLDLIDRVLGWREMPRCARRVRR